VRLPGKAWRAIHRVKNAWYDLRAMLAGYCNHCPNDGTPGSGGYTFWRCGLRRGHDGLHRSNNYVWTDDGNTSYLPLPYGHPQGAAQPRAWSRTPAMTRRQRRTREAWHQEQDARRRARLGA
jgi:hypothetical protein